MSYGFALTSGTATPITINSDNDAVGVFVDYFNVGYNTTVTRTYSSFTGSQFFAILVPENYTKLVRTDTTITNSTKTVSVTVLSSTNTVNQVGVNVIVLGK
jgi:hypothetical protein